MIQLNDLIFVCFLLVQLNNLMMFLGVKLLSHNVHFVCLLGTHKVVGLDFE
jgi:hypothetical protein